MVQESFGKSTAKETQRFEKDLFKREMNELTNLLRENVIALRVCSTCTVAWQPNHFWNVQGEGIGTNSEAPGTEVSKLLKNAAFNI